MDVRGVIGCRHERVYLSVTHSLTHSLTHLSARGVSPWRGCHSALGNVPLPYGARERLSTFPCWMPEREREKGRYEGVRGGLEEV